MNAPDPEQTAAAPGLHRLALAALARVVPADSGAPESEWLVEQTEGVALLPFAQWRSQAPACNRRLLELGADLRLVPAEVIAVAFAVEVEFDPMLGRICAWLQSPVGSARPTLGLLQAMTQAMDLGESLAVLAQGAALRSGLLCVDDPNRPLPERAFRVPLPLALALRGHSSTWPGTQRVDDARIPAPPSLHALAGRQANYLRAGGALVTRSGHPREARLAAGLVADALGRAAVLIEGEVEPGLGPWLTLLRALPVLLCELAPGERQRLPDLPGYAGPVLVASGLEGSFVDGDGDPVACWRVPVPTAAERAVMWCEHLDRDDAQRVGHWHRYSAAHIALLGRAARREAVLDGEDRVGPAHLARAARAGAAGELGTLAQLLAEDVPDEALVVSEEVRGGLLALQQRCRQREILAEALGAATRTRYRPGVRALFVGPSGTGKSLAVGWLACQLGLPLYRVDLAAVSSKYIGETEKNLAQLFARAEHAEAVLMFDEADALFGKRTDVKDSNDRFANAQTNYLLQRIESFDGIAILTSNSRARFDSAFTRRLDTILEFPVPGPQERRDLWLAHLGERHSLTAADLNRVAAASELSGGHIRNSVLAAAVSTAASDTPLRADAVGRAIAAEYRKLGKAPPLAAALPEIGANT